MKWCARKGEENDHKQNPQKIPWLSRDCIAYTFGGACCSLGESFFEPLLKHRILPKMFQQESCQAPSYWWKTVTLWHKTITYEKLFWKKKCNTTNVTCYSLKMSVFPEISRAQNPSKIPPKNSQGIVAIIISCQESTGWKDLVLNWPFLWI